MKRNFRKYLALLLMAIIYGLEANAQVHVTASLDSATILMGRIDTLRIFVDREADRQGAFPLFHKLVAGSYVTLLNDTIEIGAPRIDTIKTGGGRITERLVMPVQVFDSGKYTIPGFVYLTADDSVASNDLELEVVPVKVGDNEMISDYADISDPSNKSFWDWMPDWLYDLWWLWLLILAAIAAAIYFGRKYRRTGKFITLPEKPQPKPWDVALQRLDALKEKNLWENGMEKEYFTDLTDILRDYLFQRFGINAMEMTSRQIMQTLADEADVKEKRDYIRRILSVADFVKFAKVRPMPADNVAAFDNAVAFVKETIPAEPDPQNDVEQKSNASDKKGGER